MRFTMPLALDLISALVMGSTLPVATTLFASGPCSTLAFLSSGILDPPRVNPMMTTPTINAATIMAAMMKSFFFLLLPLPFATNPSAENQKIVRLGYGTRDREGKFRQSPHLRGVRGSWPFLAPARGCFATSCFGCGLDKAPPQK